MQTPIRDSDLEGFELDFTYTGAGDVETITASGFDKNGGAVSYVQTLTYDASVPPKLTNISEWVKQ